MKSLILLSLAAWFLIFFLMDAFAAKFVSSLAIVGQVVCYFKEGIFHL